MPSSPLDMHRSRRGFTLIELLIVVVIIGLLAAIAIPKFNNTKGKAHWAAMRSDLRNLATAQEAYFYENQAYATSMAQINFKASTGVQLTIHPPTGPGWSATATHPMAWPHTCSIFVGAVSPPPVPATVEGVVACN